MMYTIRVSDLVPDAEHSEVGNAGAKTFRMTAYSQSDALAGDGFDLPVIHVQLGVVVRRVDQRYPFIDVVVGSALQYEPDWSGNSPAVIVKPDVPPDYPRRADTTG